MHPDEAQAALDEIRTRREQSRAAETRHGLSPTYLAVLASVLLISYASFELPNPWGGAMLFPIVAVLAVLAFIYTRRAPVLRRPTAAETIAGVAAGLLLAVMFYGLAAAADAAGLPLPHLIAAVVGSAVCLLLARPAAALTRRH